MSLVFETQKHVDYIRKVSADIESFEYLVSQHLRMSGVYWGLTSLSLLNRHLLSDENENENKETKTGTESHSESEREIERRREREKEQKEKEMVQWVLSCFDPLCGGFGGNVGHDAHLLYTLSALQILALYDSLQLVNREKVIEFVCGLQQTDGSFCGDKWGEVDTRFSYCALSVMALLGALDSDQLNVPKAVDFVVSCKNFDGGFGAVPGAESHAGQIFCCIGALSIAGALQHVDENLLGWWLSERQCDSGGLNGRPEKQADVCYSWWILSALSIIGRTSWINCNQLAQFILECQDKDEGGISDRPGNMSDVFHTFFGISGLLLLNYFEDKPEYAGFINIDPTYALPKTIVEKLGLPAQTLPPVS